MELAVSELKFSISPTKMHDIRRPEVGAKNALNMAGGEGCVVEEVAGALKLYSDGSILRTDEHLIINIPPSQKPREEEEGIATKDIVIQTKEKEEHNGSEVWVRIYLPPPGSTLFPVFLYFHGGGFCFLSPAFMGSHRFCVKLASALSAIIVSVNYRLAPEHRLPVAYEDAVTALDWVRSQKDGSSSESWLKSYADLSNLFLVGDSAGGNIVHHLLIRDKEGINIRGAILLQPFFGGEQRTQSEIKCPEDDGLVSVKLYDTFWRLSLPVGATKNHLFSNPCMFFESSGVRDVAFPPMLLVLGGKDCLRDRGLEYSDVMKRWGKKIEIVEFDEEGHGFHNCFEEKCGSFKSLMQLLALFVSSKSSELSLSCGD